MAIIIPLHNKAETKRHVWLAAMNRARRLYLTALFTSVSINVLLVLYIILLSIGPKR